MEAVAVLGGVYGVNGRVGVVGRGNMLVSIGFQSAGLRTAKTNVGKKLRERKDRPDQAYVCCFSAAA